MCICSSFDTEGFSCRWASNNVCKLIEKCSRQLVCLNFHSLVQAVESFSKLHFPDGWNCVFFVPCLVWMWRVKCFVVWKHPEGQHVAWVSSSYCSNRNAITESVVFLLVPICHMLNFLSLGPGHTLNKDKISPKCCSLLKVTTHMRKKSLHTTFWANYLAVHPPGRDAPYEKWAKNWLPGRKMGLYLNCAIINVCHDIGLLLLVLKCWKLVFLSLTDQNVSKTNYICVIWPNEVPVFDGKLTQKVEKLWKRG